MCVGGVGKIKALQSIAANSRTVRASESRLAANAMEFKVD